MPSDEISVRARFGASVRRLRLEAGMSQEALATAASLDRTYVSGIERGRRNPSLEIIERIAAALACEPSRLFQEHADGDS